MVAGAITKKGVETAADATFAVMADNISQIETGVELHGAIISVTTDEETLIGKDETAACPVQYIVLTNDAHITWEKVIKSILSSQSTDWLEDTIIIGMTAVH